MTIEQIDISIKNSKNILLVSHINPDGDTLGSMCGLYSLIKDNYKKKCEMVAVSKISSTYEFLPYVEEVKSVEDFLSRFGRNCTALVGNQMDNRFSRAKIFNQKRTAICYQSF